MTGTKGDLTHQGVNKAGPHAEDDAAPDEQAAASSSHPETLGEARKRKGRAVILAHRAQRANRAAGSDRRVDSDAAAKTVRAAQLAVLRGATDQAVETPAAEAPAAAAPSAATATHQLADGTNRIDSSVMVRSAGKPADSEKPKRVHRSREPTKADNPDVAESVEHYLESVAKNV